MAANGECLLFLRCLNFFQGAKVKMTESEHLLTLSRGYIHYNGPNFTGFLRRMSSFIERVLNRTGSIQPALKNEVLESVIVSVCFNGL